MFQTVLPWQTLYYAKSILYKNTEVVGFMALAKPQNDMNTDAEEWRVTFIYLHLVS